MIGFAIPWMELYRFRMIGAPFVLALYSEDAL